MPKPKALQETVLCWVDRVLRQQIGLDTGLSDMTQQDLLQRDGELTDCREARRRAWMEEYREERRQEGFQEGLQEGLRLTRHLLTRQAARRFGPQIGQCLAKEVADVDDVARFEQIGVLHPSSGVRRFDQMDGNWRQIVTAVVSGASLLRSGWATAEKLAADCP